MFATVEKEEDAETFKFDAEVARVMDIIINSLYSDKSVFLRELVSNAADACDKRRFLSLTSSSTSSSSVSPSVKIRGFKDGKKLVIEDTGVGMTKDELVNNLGKIASSGTKKFQEALESKSDDLNLIGQFGVGFYSGFLVADKMTVETRSSKSGEEVWYRWESQAGSDYTIKQCDKPERIDEEEEEGDREVGTRLTLHLKDDCLEFAEDYRLKELLSKYSEFIEYPISVFAEKTDYKQVPDEEANKELKEGEVEKTKTVTVTKEEFERVNNQKPIWLRSPRDVTDSEYTDFYKGAFKSSYDDPMAHTHFILEGQVECKSVLYIPGMLPFEMSKDMFDENTHNLRLYVKRVFINDQFEDLIPRYLKFVRGVVDSDDLPLNVGREILQKSKMLGVINKRLVRKSLDMVKSIAEKGEDEYMKFWRNFGKYIKVGVVEDSNNVQELAGLCRFQSTETNDKEWTSLEDYVKRMKDGQSKIYYVSGDGRAQVEMSPCLEGMKKNGYEVLYMVEPLDEIAMQTLGKFGEFDVADATKEKLEEGEEEKKAKEEAEERLKGTLEFMKEILGDQVESVGVSTSLSSSPASLVQGAYGMSPSMQRYMEAQAVAMGEDDDAIQGMMGGMNKARLEVNPGHEIVGTLDKLVKGGDKERAEDFGRMIYDLASITSGRWRRPRAVR